MRAAVAALGGAVPGRSEPLHGARRKPCGTLVRRAELEAVAVCLFEVVAEDLVELDETGAVLLEPVGEALVQFGAGPWAAPRTPRPDQQVAEAVGVVAR